MGRDVVAVKKMRVGLVDEAGFGAFASEVSMLAAISHDNIVAFKGYGLDPMLLIVMEFVEGGTLLHWLGTLDPLNPPT